MHPWIVGTAQRACSQSTEPAITVRSERHDDGLAVANVVRRAYAGIPCSDHREHLMIDRLRGTQAYIPAFSLVAEIRDPQFGYERLSRYPITPPFDAPDENCMILSLTPRALDGVAGAVCHAQDGKTTEVFPSDSMQADNNGGASGQ